MRRIAGEVKIQFGTLDTMVNSAGTSHIGPMVINSSESWREVIETNLMGAVASSHAVLRHMIPAKWGRIIHIGSISAEVGAAYNVVYAASKAGVAGLVRSLALEVARTGITVNAVAPSPRSAPSAPTGQSSRSRCEEVLATGDTHAELWQTGQRPNNASGSPSQFPCT